MGTKVRLKIGELSRKQINVMLQSLPGEITFIDADDKIQFYTQHENPIFKRTPDLIGLDIRVCHKDKSNLAIDQMIAKFKNKDAKIAESWFDLHGKSIYIRYIPLYDDDGKYEGIIEFVEEIGRIRKLRGTRKKSILS